MDTVYTDGQTYTDQDFTERGLAKGTYENCTFTNCQFFSADLAGMIFSECVFSGCDLSMANLKGTAFRGVTFGHCKMLGLRFDDCQGFLLSFLFDGCLLDFASFYKLKLKNTGFKDCKLTEAEFVETDLTNAVFEHCDLDKAIFEKSILTGADFRTAYHFNIDPELNKLQKAKFSTANITGLLTKYKIVIE